MNFLRFLIIAAACAFTACGKAEIPEYIEQPTTLLEEQSIEQLPSTLSIEHFGRMKLVGTGLTLDRVMEKNDAYTKYGVSYDSNGLRVTGVFLIPNTDERQPLLITNHGYIDPAVYTQGRGLKREEDFLARQGFAVFHPDYRGHANSDESPMTEKIYDGNLEYAMDSANAILAVRASHLKNVDASRVGMLGHSMGGGVTLAILTARPDLVNAAVLYAPVHARVWENFMRWRAKREEGDRTIEQFGTYEDNPAVWDKLSPATYLGNIDTPVMLFQGDKDKDVPVSWADELHERMTTLERDITYVRYEGESHEFSFMWSDFMKKSARFFQQELVDAE